MQISTRGKSWRWARDMALGAAIFVLIPVLAQGLVTRPQGWTLDEAAAGEVIATRAVEVSSPAGPGAENAIVAAAQLRPSGVPMQAQRLNELAVLGLTFSLLVALNLAFWRHLRRVDAASRLQAARQRSR